MPKSYKLHHGTYRIEYVQIDGLCELPTWAYKHHPQANYYTITIDPRLKGKARLDTIVHELMHAEHPAMSEADITRTATNIASVIYGEGYREGR